jgi:hypothetical protein
MDKYWISVFLFTRGSRADWKAEQATTTSDWGPPARPLSLSRLDTILSQVPVQRGAVRTKVGLKYVPFLYTIFPLKIYCFEVCTRAKIIEL